MTKRKSHQYCYTLDVLTDGSEHTGNGTIFLSVWKVPPQQQVCSFESNKFNANFSWLIGKNNDTAAPVSEGNHDNPDNVAVVPTARYALSGVGDATARLCADQRFKLASTRACFVPATFTSSGSANGSSSSCLDGLSALFLALNGAGASSLHVVIPKGRDSKRNSDDGDDSLVEELAGLTLGEQKSLDIRICEVRDHDDDSSSLAWWKVYEDEHLIVHATPSKALLLSSNDSSSPLSLVYLYSFPTAAQARRANDPASCSKNLLQYRTLALFPPKCPNVAFALERLGKEKNLPMIHDTVSMQSIDYVLFLDPSQPPNGLISMSLSSTSDAASRNSQILMTLPDWQQQQEDSSLLLPDRGILIRSQQIHRYFRENMPRAFALESSNYNEGSTTGEGRNFGDSGDKQITVLQSGTSIVLERTIHYQPQELLVWDRRKTLWKKDLKQEWLRPSLDSLRPFLRISSLSPTTKPISTPADDENEIDLSESDNESKGYTTAAVVVSDENEIDLESESTTGADDEIEIELDSEVENSIQGVHDDENEIDLESEAENSTEEKEVEISNSIQTVSDIDPMKQKDASSSRSRRNPQSTQDETFATGDHDGGPRLVVLGTGCATPSAYRGASGYALILPGTKNGTQESLGVDRGKHWDNQIYILDCGEGVSTMLSRHCSPNVKDWKRKVRGIWISHAHLDHYGGLPTLLRLLWHERENLKSKNERNSFKLSGSEPVRKRPRHNQYKNPIPVPWVMAPPKVLRYLDLILDCNRGRSRDGKTILFEPRWHNPNAPPFSPMNHIFPFIHFESFKVYHNCHPSFGLLVGWKKPSRGSMDRSIRDGGYQFLCYSGDTRPCLNLVRACQRALQRQYNTSRFDDVENSDFFVIHEATYQDTEETMARNKKHSTISEAFRIASQIPRCSRVLMTHFSQRYDNSASPASMPRIEESSTNNATQNSSGSMRNMGFANNSTNLPLIGLAVDGLWIHF